MNFVLLTDEVEEFINLVNHVFNKKAEIKKFNLMNNQKVLLLKNNNEVIGCSLLTIKHDPIKSKDSYYIDYLCIKEEYRNKGLGKKMLYEIERRAKEDNITFIELTSNKERVNARKMYLDFGMKIKGTDLFIKEVK